MIDTILEVVRMGMEMLGVTGQVYMLSMAVGLSYGLALALVLAPFVAIAWVVRKLWPETS